MRTFLQQHPEDFQLMADLQGRIDREGLLRMRAQIDRMRSQNMRLVVEHLSVFHRVGFFV